ncbi:MAG: hypothetical protein CUN55_09545 [Phototrophicales bacterium]|nr:MAG: hypothetical protein CUN55_09545 [Phototrophicales bacterium]
MQRVLILDNEISFIVRLRKALESQNFEVKTARRPSNAYEEITAGQYDIAIIDIDFDEFEAVLKHLRTHHPKLPIILSGHSKEDVEAVQHFSVDAYINKPYVARDLITIIEWTLAQVAQHGPSEGVSNKSVTIEEPPINEDATIGDMMTALLTPDNESGVVVHTAIPDTLPESTSQLEERLLDEPPISAEDSVASRVLRLSHDDNQLKKLLHSFEAELRVRPLPSWHKLPPSEAQDKVIALLGELPPMVLPPIPSATPTQPVALPELDLIPEDPTPLSHLSMRSQQLNHELLDALAEAEDIEDSRLQAVLSQIQDSQQEEPVLQEELVPTTVKEITQSMGIVLDEEDESSSEIDEEINPEEAELTLVAQAALQLTQLSLESAAIGTMLTYDDRIIASIGDLSKPLWQDLAAQVILAWEQSDGGNTRLIYRTLERYGQVLLFSLKTTDDLILTLIFNANTPLKTIRRQAKRLTEALANVEPDALSAELGTSYPITPIKEEPSAATTLPSRPTDLRPPQDLRRTTNVAEAVSITRKDENYTGYALAWLIENEEIVLHDELQQALETWLYRIAEENLWEIIALDIQDKWINLHIEAPAKEMPNVIAETLMQQTAQAIRDTYPALRDETIPIWSEGYSILTPGRLMSEREIERFIRYSNN